MIAYQHLLPYSNHPHFNFPLPIHHFPPVLIAEYPQDRFQNSNCFDWHSPLLIFTHHLFSSIFLILLEPPWRQLNPVSFYV